VPPHPGLAVFVLGLRQLVKFQEFTVVPFLSFLHGKDQIKIKMKSLSPRITGMGKNSKSQIKRGFHLVSS
jgi:hypothetical protein